MGDTIIFRGTRRFLVATSRRSISLEKLYRNRYVGMVTYYNITPAERKTIRVAALATADDRARARKLRDEQNPTHIRYVWAPGDPEDPDFIVYRINGNDERYPWGERERRR